MRTASPVATPRHMPPQVTGADRSTIPCSGGRFRATTLPVSRADSVALMPPTSTGRSFPRSPARIRRRGIYVGTNERDDRPERRVCLQLLARGRPGGQALGSHQRDRERLQRLRSEALRLVVSGPRPGKAVRVCEKRNYHTSGVDRRSARAPGPLRPRRVLFRHRHTSIARGDRARRPPPNRPGRPELVNGNPGSRRDRDDGGPDDKGRGQPTCTQDLLGGGSD